MVVAISSLAQSREAAANGGDHDIHLHNRCKEQIWVGQIGAPDITLPLTALAPTCNAENAARVCPSGACQDGSCTCPNGDTQCAFGSTADTTASCVSGLCVRSTSVTVAATWNGRFWARTGCSGTDSSFVCETGQCGPPGGGPIECTVSANQATLFEIAMADTSAFDSYDVSLVSGYNVPITVKAILPGNTLRWTATMPYMVNQNIIEKVGDHSFRFENTGVAGTSGTTRPVFPGVQFESVTDANGIVWTNVGVGCQTSGCRRGGIKKEQCPPVLRIMSGETYLGCDAPANVCAEPGSGCEADLTYYQCQNNDGAQDLFNNYLTLESANGGTYTCFSADDCPPGATCEIDPEFVSGYKMAKGAGICTPAAQNGACTPSDDGDKCPAVDFPFVNYECQTLSNVGSNAQVCLPPKTRGVGALWWNADNWTEVGMSPSCAVDTDCSGAQKCLQPPAVPNGGLEQCPDGGSCTCWNPQTCTSSAQCAPGECLDEAGIENADCATTETCYCAPQGIYSGTCGATNAKWLQAGRKISTAGARWPITTKERCPLAYSFQFDDPSSNWTCPNPAADLNDYRVIFCGGADD